MKYKRYSKKERECWPQGHRPCAKCGEMLELHQFYKHSSGLWGHCAVCIKCTVKGTSKIYVEKTLQDLLFEWAKVRAKKKNMEFSITKEDIIIPECCPVFGKPFERNTVYAASVDRFDSTKGYVPGNISVISLKANKLKNNATLEQLELLVRWIKQN